MAVSPIKNSTKYGGILQYNYTDNHDRYEPWNSSLVHDNIPGVISIVNNQGKTTSTIKGSKLAIKSRLDDYTNDMPFIALSPYTLLPYYYYKRTSRYTLIIVITDKFDKTFCVTGYNKNSHRVFRRYFARNMQQALKTIYK